MPVMCDGFIQTILSGHHLWDVPREFTSAYTNAVEYKPNSIKYAKPVDIKDKSTQKRLKKSNTCTIS